MANLSIFNGLLQPPKSVADYDQQAATTQGMQLQNATRQMANETAGLQRDRANQLLTLSRGLPQGASDLDRLSALRNSGFYDEADKLSTSLDNRSKSVAAAAKDTADAASTTQKTSEARKSALLRAVPTFNSSDDAKQFLANGVAGGHITMQEAQQMVSRVPDSTANPQGFKDWQLGTLRSLMAPDKQMEYVAPTANTVLTNQTSTANNAATNARAASEGAANRAQQERASIRTDSRVRSTAAAGGKPPAGFTWGPTDEDGQQSLVAIPGGPADQNRKTKDIPVTVNKAIIDGKQSISNIDSAIQAIQSYPDALGVTNAVPGAQTVRQFTDPKGVAVRAQVSNIGSLTLHDRSGAAVSASEFPRLAPFIPSASDNPTAAVSKLKQMKRIAEEELGLFAGTYGPDNGYKAHPLLKGGGTATPAAASSVFDQADAILKGGK